MINSTLRLGDSNTNDAQSVNQKLADDLKDLKRNMEGDKNEDHENHVIQNPYYDDGTIPYVEGKSNTKIQPDLNDIEFVTATENIYYQI